MFCKTCGAEVPDGALFCNSCGTSIGASAPAPAQDLTDGSTIMGAKGVTPVPPPVPAAASKPVPPPPAAGPVPPPPPGGSPPIYGGYGPPGAPPKNSRLGMWIGIGVAAAIVIAAGVTIPVLLLDNDGGGTSVSTTRITSAPTSETTATTTGSGATSSSSTSTSGATTSSTTTTSVPAGPAGDSDGEWVQVDAPEVPQGTYTINLSEQVLLFESNDGDAFHIHAYVMDTGDFVELPLEGTAPPVADLDGPVAVWQEAQVDDDTGEYNDQRIYAYIVPSQEKIQIADSGTGPQVGLPWVTWTEQEPWEMNPEEFFWEHVYAVELDSEGYPAGQAEEWVTAPAYMYGELGWIYSLSRTHFAWENHAPHHLIDAGSYVFEIGSEAEPVKLGNESWRPSLAGDYAVYFEGDPVGLMSMNLTTGEEQTLDPLGDFATAGPTFAAYSRMIESGDSYTYEIVAKGYTGGYEQVLAETDVDPYFLPPIAVSESRVAFLIDEQLYLYEWQGR